MYQLWSSSHRPASSVMMEGWPQSPCPQWPCHLSCRLLLLPGVVPCPEEGIHLWSTDPVPQDSGHQRGTQERNSPEIASGLTLVGRGWLMGLWPAPGGLLLLRSFWDPHLSRLLFAHVFPHLLPSCPRSGVSPGGGGVGWGLAVTISCLSQNEDAPQRAVTTLFAE